MRGESEGWWKKSNSSASGERVIGEPTELVRVTAAATVGKDGREDPTGSYPVEEESSEILRPNFLPSAPFSSLSVHGSSSNEVSGCRWKISRVFAVLYLFFTRSFVRSFVKKCSAAKPEKTCWKRTLYKCRHVEFAGWAAQGEREYGSRDDSVFLVFARTIWRVMVVR